MHAVLGTPATSPGSPEQKTSSMNIRKVLKVSAGDLCDKGSTLVQIQEPARTMCSYIVVVV
jgi:hypothetical protein